jgi:hypothetical protein
VRASWQFEGIRKISFASICDAKGEQAPNGQGLHAVGLGCRESFGGILFRCGGVAAKAGIVSQKQLCADLLVNIAGDGCGL